MILLAGFLDVVFRALVFIGLALSIGGVAFYYFVLSPTRASDSSVRRSASLIAAGALIVAAAQILALLNAVAALAEQSAWPVGLFLKTQFARAGLLHSAAAMLLAGAALFLRGCPGRGRMWVVAALIGALTVLISAWLTHGASRLEHAPALMTVTSVHKLAAAVWIGGLMHLVGQRRLPVAAGVGDDTWSGMVSRFSPVALASVAVMVAAGMYLIRQYIGSGAAMVGTAYGAMVLTKISLTLVLLLLGGVNNLTIRAWTRTGDPSGILRRVPVFAEVEAAIGIVILMTSAALTNQPPSVDVKDRATPAEVAMVFMPKTPQLAPPPRGEMLRTASSSTDPYALPGKTSRIQSDFNHNISGILVILIGVGAFLSRVTGWRWTRHWPLLFLPLALFLLVIGEPNGWPLGPEPFWATLIAPEVLSHRLATLFVLALGFATWRVETGHLAQSRWRYLLPALSIIGGALLLTHSHSVFAIKRAYLIEVSHNALAVFAVIAGAAAWVETRMPGREGRVGSYIWPVFFILLGVVLLFYRET